MDARRKTASQAAYIKYAKVYAKRVSNALGFEVLRIQEFTVACLHVISEYELHLLSWFRAGAVLENGPCELLHSIFLF